jgi:hypothetical protein
VPLPTVVVEVAPADADPRLLHTLVEACTNAVASGHCELADSATDEESAYAVAVVSWQNAERVRVEVGVRQDSRAEWRSKRLSFRSEDDEAERWRAAGLTIGTLVGEIEQTVAEQSEQPALTPGEARPPQPDSAPEVRPAPAMRPSSRNIWLDLGFSSGPGLDSDAWRLGGFARAAYRPHSSLFAAISASHAIRPEDARALRISWTTAGLGGGLALSPGHAAFGFDLRAEMLLQYVLVSATDPDDDQQGSAHAWLVGLQAGVDVSLRVARPFELLLGAQVSGLNKVVEVRLKDELAGEAARIQYALQGGARFRFDVD